MKLHKAFLSWLVLLIYLWPTSIMAQGPDCSGYVSRGDDSDYDFDESDLAEDSNWHDLDLSGIVSDSDAVLVHVRLQCAGAANSIFGVRADGYTGVNTCIIRTTTSSYAADGDCLVQLVGSRTIEYYVKSGTTSEGLFVRGWWTPCDGGGVWTFMGKESCMYIPENPAQEGDIPILTVSDCWGVRPFTHTTEHQIGGVQEINVTGLSGILTDTQDAGWFQGLAITITGLSDNDVLAWNALSEQWEPTTITGVGGITMPEVITAVISGTVPVVITDTWHYTQMLSSGNDIAIMRSFTYGEASIAIGLFLVAALLGLHILFTFLRR